MSNDTNAKQEFVQHTLHVQESSAVRCAAIYRPYHYREEGEYIAILKDGHSLQEYVDFLEKLDFCYDSGYGGQWLDGIIWYDDGTWSERGEYDGSEWWGHRTVPPILDILKGE